MKNLTINSPKSTSDSSDAIKVLLKFFDINEPPEKIRTLTSGYSLNELSQAAIKTSEFTEAYPYQNKLSADRSYVTKKVKFNNAKLSLNKLWELMSPEGKEFFTEICLKQIKLFRKTNFMIAILAPLLISDLLILIISSTIMSALITNASHLKKAKELLIKLHITKVMPELMIILSGILFIPMISCLTLIIQSETEARKEIERWKPIIKDFEIIRFTDRAVKELSYNINVTATLIIMLKSMEETGKFIVRSKKERNNLTEDGLNTEYNALKVIPSVTLAICSLSVITSLLCSYYHLIMPEVEAKLITFMILTCLTVCSFCICVLEYQCILKFDAIHYPFKEKFSFYNTNEEPSHNIIIPEVFFKQAADLSISKVLEFESPALQVLPVKELEHIKESSQVNKDKSKHRKEHLI